MSQKQKKKGALVFPYKKICINEEEVGRLYLAGTCEWGDQGDLVTALLSLKKGKHTSYFRALIVSPFFFTVGSNFIDVSEENEMVYGTLASMLPVGGDAMGLIKNMADRMGTVLEKHLPAPEKM